MASTPNENLRILSVGDDHTLLDIRTMVLQQKGFTVISASSSEVLKNSFDHIHIVVLCRSIAFGRIEEVARKIRAEHPNAWIVRLSHLDGRHEPLFDAVCDPTFGPAVLLDILESLTGKGGRLNREAFAYTGAAEKKPAQRSSSPHQDMGRSAA